MNLEGEGRHTFRHCPKCGGPVSSEYDQKGNRRSPAQEAAERVIRNTLGGTGAAGCAVCGTDLTNAPAVRDNRTGAMYCFTHREFAGR
jgi:hypothetical protein